MVKANDNIFILVAYLVIQIIALILMLLVGFIEPGIFDNDALFVEYSSYVNLIVMLGAFIYFSSKYRTYFKNQFNLFKSDLARMIGLAFATFVAIYLVSVFSAVIMDWINVTGDPVNQESLDAVANSTLLARISLVIFTVLLAPMIEEFIFRKGVFGLFGNYKPIVPIVLSGVTFGLIHVLSDPNLLQVIPYLLSGITIAYMFHVADRNIYVVTIGHALYNLLITIFMFTL